MTVEWSWVSRKHDAHRPNHTMTKKKKSVFPRRTASHSSARRDHTCCSLCGTNVIFFRSPRSRSTVFVMWIMTGWPRPLRPCALETVVVSTALPVVVPCSCHTAISLSSKVSVTVWSTPTESACVFLSATSTTISVE